MARVTCMKRGNYWQYRFEGAKIGGKRKRFTKGGFATKKEAMQAGTKALAEYRLGHKNIQVTLQIYTHLTQKMQNQTVEILNQIPIDDSCTPNLSERGTVVTPDLDFVLPCEKSEKPCNYAGFRDNAFQVGVQNCTPDENLGYKKGTKHKILPLKASFESKKRATK